MWINCNYTDFTANCKHLNQDIKGNSYKIVSLFYLKYKQLTINTLHTIFVNLFNIFGKKFCLYYF